MTEYVDNLLPQKELSLATHTRSFVVNGEFLLAIHSETKGVAILFLARQPENIFLCLLFLSIQFCFFDYRNKRYEYCGQKPGKEIQKMNDKLTGSMIRASKQANNCSQGPLRSEILSFLPCRSGLFCYFIYLISLVDVVSTSSIMIKSSHWVEFVNIVIRDQRLFESV